MRKTATNGFTLVELLMVVAIIGILMAVALPAYNDYVLKGKLAEAMTVLSDLQVREETYYSDNRTYAALTPRTGQTLYFDATSCALRGGDSQTYDCTATSTSLGYSYKVSETGAKTTTKPDGTTVSCWLKAANGGC